MAVDEALSARFRNALSGVAGVSEKRMMGGQCFFLNGNMIGGADRTKEGLGRFMFRLGKANQARGEAMPGAVPMVQGGRLMSGFFFVEEERCNGVAVGGSGVRGDAARQVS
ncbi:MAG: TfoX/Sxy family protein, partial [Pseudomonadota bacterium]